MRQAFRFVIALIVGLFVCTVLAHVALSRMTRNWFEHDVEMRAALAIATSHERLMRGMERGETATLIAQLTQIARDEHVLGARICRADSRSVASTPGYPDFSCHKAVRLFGEVSGQEEGEVRSQRVHLFGAEVLVSRVALDPARPERGFVLLLNDMSFVDRREQLMQQMLWLAFAILGIGASLVTLFAVRLSWRSWTEALRSVVRGTENHPEFAPLMSDVRELVGRLSSEMEQEEGRGGHWTAERLQMLLKTELHGEQIVVVANREPYIHDHTPEGGVRVVHPASGLVTALEPVMNACSGTWIAHGGGSADRENVDRFDRVRVPPGAEAYVLRRVWLSEDEERGYYYGFANEGLWPLCHVAHTRPVFRAEDWDAYRVVNQRFAEAVFQEVSSDDPIVLVQDYHFALAPRIIRERLPKATILTFWHIPWPNAERFAICPFREELLYGMLGSSIMGFHTQQHCNNFLDSVDTFIEARIDRERNAVVRRAQLTVVRPYPISIEWPVRWTKDMPSAEECRKELLAELGLPPDTLLGVGVDRLDYTKGIEDRLLAVERVLERYPDLRGRFTFVQLAAPSRVRIARYQELGDAVEGIARRIVERFGSEGYRPVVLARAHHEPPTVFRYYRAAHFCYVSSLHDGMNLVAKEFVAARDDGLGVLVLSHFTGAARELSEALIVNPYDLEQASAAIATALRMPEAEQRQRMQAMRALVSELNVYRWAGRMLLDAAELRRKERVFDRISQAPAWSPSFARS